MKALILGNHVADVAAQEFPVAEPMFWVDCPDNCVAGVWTYNGVECVAPAPAPSAPTVVTIRQAKLALHAAGLLDDVDAAVAAADRAVQIEWEYATEVRRNWPTLVALQATLGLTDAQVDNLFAVAANL